MIAGGIMFAALGKDPVEAIRIIFWDPLFNAQFASYSRPQLLIKAGPLILIAIGLSLGFKAGIWNIGAEGQYIIGAICGAAFGLAFWPSESPLLFPGMVIAGLIGGWAWAMIPGVLKTRFRTNEILVSLLLVYVAEAILASAATSWLRSPDAMGFPGSRNLARHPGTDNPELIAGTGMHWGVLAAFIAVIAAYVLMNRHVLGYQIRLAGQAPRAARFAGVDPNRLVLLCLGISGALAGAAGLFEVSGPAGQISIDFNVGYGFTAIIVAFLGRLHPIGILLAGLLMALTYIGGELAQLMLGIPAPRDPGLPGHAAVLPARARRAVELPHPPETDGGGLMLIDPVTLVVALIIASTPVLLAAIGELVVEKTGVLNLGVEGMMIVGAVTGFIVAVETGSVTLAYLAGMAGGMVLSALFAILTQVLLSNQVATGLALTLFGIGLAALLGVGYPGLDPAEGSGHLPASAAGHPHRRADPLRPFGDDLPRGHAGRHGVVCSPAHAPPVLILRAVGRKPRRGACTGLQGHSHSYPSRSFSAAPARGWAGRFPVGRLRVQNWIEGMTVGAGWIRAGARSSSASWKPWRVLFGAYLFGRHLGAAVAPPGGGGERFPSRCWTARPMFVTIIVLVLIFGRTAARAALNAPASPFGKVFHASG